MTNETQRITDLVDLHALCARYMAYTSQFLQDRWLEVFTPDAEYNAFGTPYTLERFPALLAAAPRGQFIGNMPVVDFDGDTRHRHAALRLHRPAVARHAPRLVSRRVPCARPTGWRIRRRVHHVHAQARWLRLRRQHDPLAGRSRKGTADSGRLTVTPRQPCEAVEAELPGLLGRDAHPRVLDEAVPEPAVHHRLLDEQRRCAACRSP